MLKREILNFEFNKLSSGLNMIILAGFIIILFFSCWHGATNYKSITVDAKAFREIEKDKAALCNRYTLYGSREVRLFFIPGPLSIIFHDTAVFPGLTARIDTAEKFDINNSFQGKDVFAYSGGYLDFAGLMLFGGALLALLYGYDGTRRREFLKYISSLSGNRNPGLSITITRVIILNLVFMGLCGLASLWLPANGIHAGNIFFLAYVPGLALVVTCFALIGALTGTLENKTSRLILLPLVYFVLIFLLPWLIRTGVSIEAQNGLQSTYRHEHEIHKQVIALEKEFHEQPLIMKNGEPVPDNIKAMITGKYEALCERLRQLELKRLNEIQVRIKTYQTLSALFPTTFYLSAATELSSKGFQGFSAFYRFACDTKFKLASFHLKQRFSLPAPGNNPEPFIKENENLFYGHSQLPGNFVLGTTLSILYIFALLWALARKPIMGIKKKPPQTTSIDFKERNTLFALCKNNRVKENIIRNMGGQKDTVIIDKIPVTFPLSDIRAKTLLTFFCRLARVSEEKVIKNLEILGIKDLNTLTPTPEEILKFYAAVKVSGEGLNHVILNDFFKKETRRFEQDCIKLLENLEASGKKILYLSCDMYHPKKSLDDNITVDNYRLFPLPLDKITLR